MTEPYRWQELDSFTNEVLSTDVSSDALDLMEKMLPEVSAAEINREASSTVEVVLSALPGIAKFVQNTLDEATDKEGAVEVEQEIQRIETLANSLKEGEENLKAYFLESKEKTGFLLSVFFEKMQVAVGDIGNNDMRDLPWKRSIIACGRDFFRMLAELGREVQCAEIKKYFAQKEQTWFESNEDMEPAAMIERIEQWKVKSDSAGASEEKYNTMLDTAVERLKLIENVLDDDGSPYWELADHLDTIVEMVDKALSGIDEEKEPERKRPKGGGHLR